MWNEKRKNYAVKRAVQCNLFSVAVSERDNKIRQIVAGINKCVDVDVNHALLTESKYKAKIYEIQRKLIKLPKAATHLLPEVEQQLFKQLDELGVLEEAGLVRMGGNDSSVSLSTTLSS